MSEEERRARARERVREWKGKNEWLVKHQRKRRWARVRAALETARKGTDSPTRVTNGHKKGTEGKAVKYGELHYGPEPGVDVPYEEQKRPLVAVPAQKGPEERGVGRTAEEERIERWLRGKVEVEVEF